MVPPGSGANLFHFLKEEWDQSFEELREIRWVEWSEEGDWNLIWEEMEREKIILWSC